MATKTRALPEFSASRDEGVVTIDRANFTEWALKQRGYVEREEEWLAGYYHWNTKNSSIGNGSETRPEKLDEYGLNEVAFVPLGEVANAWAETTWKNAFPNIYAWYHSNDTRAWRRRSLLLIKNDTYVHTDKVYNAGAYEPDDDDYDDGYEDGDDDT